MSEKIAIGILAYNETDYIEDVVNSLCELGLPIYVIDDKSTDNTSNILKELLKENKISLIQNTKFRCRTFDFGTSKKSTERWI